MKNETPTIDAKLRSRVGSRYARRLRDAGRLPAVVYGHKSEPVAIEIDRKSTIEIIEDGAHVVNLAIDGAEGGTCLVKELQFGYLGDNVIHIDFTRVNLDDEVEVLVHLHFIGTPEAAKKPGAMLSHDVTELPVRCKVRDIPETLKVDLTKMGEMFTVGELTLPPGVVCTLDAEVPIAAIGFVTEEAEASGEGAEVASGAAEPEVITEKKAAEGDADKK